MSTLSRKNVKRVYDRVGRLQDTQAFYEQPAVDCLVEQGRFSTATNVFEFGCGTGRVAEQLLANHLPETARYLGIDISSTMVELASKRLARFGARARVKMSPVNTPGNDVNVGTDAEPGLDVFDRVLSTYVFDLLSEDDIASVIEDAHELLGEGGYLCTASLSPGNSGLSKLISQAFSTLHRISPSLLGGCRPIELLDYISAPGWGIRFHDRVRRFGITSEVVVAQRRPKNI